MFWGCLLKNILLGQPNFIELTMLNINNIRKSIFFFLILSISGCAQKERSDFVQSTALKSKVMSFNEHLGRAYAIDMIDNHLIVRDDHVDTKLTVFDLANRSKTPIYTGYAGQGPGELNNPGPIIVESDRFLLYDASKMKLFSFYLDSLVVPRYKPQEAISIQEAEIIDIKKIAKNLFVAVGVFPENRFVLVDTHGVTVGHLGTYPMRLKTGEPEYVRSIACQSMMTTNIKKNTVAIAMRYGEHIEFHSFDAVKYSADLINEHAVSLPEYTTRDNNGYPNFRPTEDTYWGYLSISSNINHVYALYSGKPQIRGTSFYSGHEVHVFDWEGNFIRKLKLDRQVTSITCNQNRLYALFDGENGYEIAEYTLDI